MAKSARYKLILQPTPDRSDPDGVRRLRRALKRLLRGYGLRCVEIQRFGPAGGTAGPWTDGGEGLDGCGGPRLSGLSLDATP